jgi:urease accessory protein
MVLIGGLLGFSATPVPGVELGISMSAIAFGLAVMIVGRRSRRGKAPVGSGGFRHEGKTGAGSAAAVLVSAFAVFHGHAHATEMPLLADAALYSAGFIMATGLVHGAGILAGLWIGLHRRVPEVAGATLAAAGFATAFL